MKNLAGREADYQGARPTQEKLGSVSREYLTGTALDPPPNYFIKAPLKRNPRI